MVLGVLLSTVKKTVSRLLVLIVGLGYGVVRPTLGNVAYRVMALGLVYFCFSAALDVASNVSQLSRLSVSARLLLIVPMALLDAFFYWWLFSGLTRTLQQLSSRRQSAKLLLYRRFSHVLLAAVLISALWVGWQMAVIVSDSLDERWNRLWIFDAFWHVLYLVVLLAICYLWRPSKNNLQYAYMDEARRPVTSLPTPCDPGYTTMPHHVYSHWHYYQPSPWPHSWGRRLRRRRRKSSCLRRRSTKGRSRA